MSSMFKKTLIYLGLGADEEYEQYGEQPASRPMNQGPTHDSSPTDGGGFRSSPQGQRPAVDSGVQMQRSTSGGTVRPLSSAYSSPPDGGSGTVRPLPADSGRIEPRPDVDTPVMKETTSAVRTLGPATSKPVAISPTTFNQAQDIGDRFKNGQAVIMNLQESDRDLRRRLVDFASGLCYALGGKMDRVADQVYMLLPTDVEVTSEDTRRALD